MENPHWRSSAIFKLTHYGRLAWATASTSKCRCAFRKRSYKGNVERWPCGSAGLRLGCPAMPGRILVRRQFDRTPRKPRRRTRRPTPRDHGRAEVGGPDRGQLELHKRVASSDGDAPPSTAILI